MNTEAILTEEQLVRCATDALIEKLGVTETTRFLALKHEGLMDSVEWHRQWQKSLDRNEFFDDVFRQNEIRYGFSIQGSITTYLIHGSLKRA